MNVIEMPASVPSIAARGVTVRIHGPMNAPISTITPMIRHHASPACHASIASLVCRYTGSITRNTTMNMCGTLGPYGIAVTSRAPFLLRQLEGEPGVEQIAQRQRDAQRRQDARVHQVGRQLHQPDAQRR